ncbi:DUF1653 domain-containing protein [Alteromonas stellipolaris]|nr:DUF1653 domain-containing protein [Alteromonas stellipolaris]MDP2537548.1 DUF1653 domain-containing protein [Alteromonas stellipolaris]
MTTPEPKVSETKTSEPEISGLRTPELRTPGRYRHYKGSDYDVYEVATHSEDESSLVVYRPCYGEKALWVRPLSMFQEEVIVDGKSVPRFAYIGDIPADEKMI